MLDVLTTKILIMVLFHVCMPDAKIAIMDGVKGVGVSKKYAHGIVFRISL